MQAASLRDRSNRWSYFGWVSSIFLGGIAALVGCTAPPVLPSAANAPTDSAESTAADATATTTSDALPAI